MRFGPLAITYHRQPQAAKASRIFGRLTAFFVSNTAIWTPRDYENFAREGYALNPYVYRAVNLISDACAGIPWHVYRTQRNGERKEIEDHPAAVLLNEKPNPYQGGSEFMQELVGYNQISGNAYIEMAGPKTGQNAGIPREVYALRPDRMRILPGDARRKIAGYEYRINGEPIRFSPDQIIHWKLWNPINDWYGMAPTEAAGRSIDQNNSSREWNVSLLQNSARPQGLLSPDGEAQLTQDEFEEMQEFFRQYFAGPANAGKSAYSSQSVKWTPTALAPAEMEWLQGLKLSAREVALCYNVPPEMLGDTETKTYASYQEARQSFYTETILPLMDEIKGKLNQALMPRFDEDRLILDYDRNDIEALREDQGQVWARIDASAEMTVNEKRQAKGLPPMDADYWLIPKGQTLLEIAEDGTIAPVMTAPPDPNAEEDAEGEDGQDDEEDAPPNAGKSED